MNSKKCVIETALFVLSVQMITTFELHRESALRYLFLLIGCICASSFVIMMNQKEDDND